MNERWNAVRPWVGTIARLVLGVVWIWASVSKLSSPLTFVQAVRAYDATPEWLSKTIGYGLPVLELALGIVLILGLTTRLAAIVSSVLFVVFLIGIIEVDIRGIQLECGCFGGGGETTGGTTYTLDILRDLGLLILAVYLVVWARTQLSGDQYLARHDNVEMPSAKRMRTDAGRRKYNAMLEQRRQAAKSRDRWVGASIAAVVVLIAVIGIGVQSGRAKIQGNLSATNASVANGVVFGKKAVATVDIYEDFQCPICEKFEQATHTTLDKDVRANLAQAKFHMMSFLNNSSSGNRYSSRAANAAICASDVSVDDFVAYHNVLYGKLDGKQVQPTEGSNGRTDADLEKYGAAAGIKGNALTTFDGCVTNETHKALVTAINERASEDGVTGTPTIKVNGKKITASLAGLNKAIAAADAQGPKPDPSKTPTPTPTPSPTTPSTSPSAVTPSATKGTTGAASTPAKVTTTAG